MAEGAYQGSWGTTWSHVGRTLGVLALASMSSGCVRVAKWQPIALTEASHEVTPTLKNRSVDRHRVTLHDGQQFVGHVRAIDTEAITITDDRARRGNPPIRIPWDRVAALEFRDENRSATIGTTATVWVLVAGAIPALVLLSKGSCPFIYATAADGQRILLGEGYSGAVGRALARDDMLRVPWNGERTIDLVIANEAHENQRTDLAELVLVDLPKGGEPVATHDAQILVVGQAQEPTAAADQRGVDQLDNVRTDDGIDWRTDLDFAVQTQHTEEGLEVSFDDVPANAALVLDGANTLWADAVSTRLWATFGKHLGTYLNALESPTPRPSTLAFRELAGLDLQVSVARGGVWEKVAVVPFLGWASTKRIAVPLPEVSGDLQVRLSGGPGFWRFDRVVVAPILDAAPTTRVVPMDEAWTDGRDDRAALATTDGLTSDLPVIYDETTLRFDVGEATTPGAAFLRLHGHYLPDPPPQPHVQLGVLRGVVASPTRVRQMSLDLWEIANDAWGNAVGVR